MTVKMDRKIISKEPTQKPRHAKKPKAKKPTTKRADQPFSNIRLFRSSLLYQTKEFFDNSTLHGVRYIAEEGRPLLERFMWFCFVATGAVAATVIIFSLWEKFQTNPTITGLDTDFHNQEVIFPTVMVCPTAPYDEKSVQEVAYVTLANYESGSEQYEPFLQTLTKLTYGLMDTAAKLGEKVVDDKPAVHDLRKFVFKMAVRCNATFGQCRYKDEPINCCEYFKPVYSEQGFCYSFNARYITPPMGEERNNDISYLYETDKKWGLTFAPLRQSYIFVHSHNEISGWDFRPQVLWDLNFAIDFLISMKQTYTTEDARQLSIGQRKCIFPDEVKLKYYNDEYTFSGCMRECRLRKSLQLCKCVPPFYAPPRALQFCKVRQLSCLAKYTPNITSISDCQHCELGCHNTVYDIEKYSKVMTTDESKEPVVTIEYLTWPIIRYKREVLFGWVDLLVSFGGIAGLFLGFSLLSGVEIVYFFTMRACCMLYKNRDELVAIEREKMKRPLPRYNLKLRPDLHAKVAASDESYELREISDKGSKKNVTSIGLMDQEFKGVKLPSEHGLVLAGISSRHQDRFEKMKGFIRPDFFQPVLAAPYSERIKPLDKNMVRTRDGLFYRGYLP